MRCAFSKPSVLRSSNTTTAGYGFSSGTPDVVAIRADVLRLYDRTVRDNGGKPVVVFGYSLGTLFASYVASDANET